MLWRLYTESCADKLHVLAVCSHHYLFGSLLFQSLMEDNPPEVIQLQRHAD
jgi:hypothetical protein